MTDSGATTANDNRANTTGPLDDYDVPDMGPSDALPVYVLVVDPEGIPSFVVDVYSSRAPAEVDKLTLADETTTAEIREHWIELPKPSKERVGR